MWQELIKKVPNNLIFFKANNVLLTLKLAHYGLNVLTSLRVRNYSTNLFSIKLSSTKIYNVLGKLESLLVMSEDMSLSSAVKAPQIYGNLTTNLL